MSRSLNGLSSPAGLLTSVLFKELNLADIPNPEQARQNLGINGSISVSSGSAPYLTISNSFDSTKNEVITLNASSNTAPNKLVAYDTNGNITTSKLVINGIDGTGDFYTYTGINLKNTSANNRGYYITTPSWGHLVMGFRDANNNPQDFFFAKPDGDLRIGTGKTSYIYGKIASTTGAIDCANNSLSNVQSISGASNIIFNNPLASTTYNIKHGNEGGFEIRYNQPGNSFPIFQFDNTYGNGILVIGHGYISTLNYGRLGISAEAAFAPSKLLDVDGDALIRGNATINNNISAYNISLSGGDGPSFSSCPGVTIRNTSSSLNGYYITSQSWGDLTMGYKDINNNETDFLVQSPNGNLVLGTGDGQTSIASDELQANLIKCGDISSVLLTSTGAGTNTITCGNIIAGGIKALGNRGTVELVSGYYSSSIKLDASGADGRLYSISCGTTFTIANTTNSINIFQSDVNGNVTISPTKNFTCTNAFSAKSSITSCFTNSINTIENYATQADFTYTISFKLTDGTTTAWVTLPPQ